MLLTRIINKLIATNDDGCLLDKVYSKPRLRIQGRSSHDRGCGPVKNKVLGVECVFLREALITYILRKITSFLEGK